VLPARSYFPHSLPSQCHTTTCLFMQVASTRYTAADRSSDFQWLSCGHGFVRSMTGAATQGKQTEVVEATMKKYFEQGKSPGDPEALASAAEEVRHFTSPLSLILRRHPSPPRPSPLPFSSTSSPCNSCVCECSCGMQPTWCLSFSIVATAARSGGPASCTLLHDSQSCCFIHKVAVSLTRGVT
jgi:hypothetical protein